MSQWRTCVIAVALRLALGCWLLPLSLSGNYFQCATAILFFLYLCCMLFWPHTSKATTTTRKTRKTRTNQNGTEWKNGSAQLELVASRIRFFIYPLGNGEAPTTTGVRSREIERKGARIIQTTTTDLNDLVVAAVAAALSFGDKRKIQSQLDSSGTGCCCCCWRLSSTNH